MRLNEKKLRISRSSPTEEYCVFEYIYRDASNYKARGKILLSGSVSQGEIAILKACLESDEYFVAEQVGIPALHKELWELTGGASSNDHALHEFVALRRANEDERDSLSLFGDLSDLLSTFRSVTTWDYSLSPNFDVV